MYSSDVREAWFAYLQATVPKQRYDIWIKYAYQLEEMEITGTISDRTLYLNRSLIKKLPEQWKKELDYYLESCGQIIRIVRLNQCEETVRKHSS